VGGDGRAVLGGGHYDNLVADVGGNPLAGVGFAMGDVMITLLMKKYGCLPDLHLQDDTVLVSVFDYQTFPVAARFSSYLRNEGINVILYPEIEKLQKQIRFADRSGIRLVIVLGPDEVEKAQVSIKNLRDHTQVTLPQEIAPGVIREMLASQ
jgi:histidyl-tRNA synthetase